MNEILTRSIDIEISESISDIYNSIMGFVNEVGLTKPDIDFILKDDIGNEYLSQMAWPDYKIALFECISLDYRFFQSNGYICLEVNNFSIEMLREKIKENVI